MDRKIGEVLNDKLEIIITAEEVRLSLETELEKDIEREMKKLRGE